MGVCDSATFCRTTSAAGGCARPVRRGEQLHRLGRVDLRHAAFLGDQRQEVRHQQRDVLAAAG